MFFELTNVLITFQNIINNMFRFFLNKFVIVYLNNILIYFKNNKKYFEHVKFVIKTFRKNNYYVKSSKCIFFLKIIKFCDYIINNEKMRINEIKLKIIQNWLQFQIVHNVCFFLKLCAYYCKFIKNFVIIMSFFYELIRKAKNKKFKTIVINFLTKNVFYSIKNVIYNNRVLIQFNIFLFFIIEINAFDFDWKIVLYQVEFDDKKRFIAFENKTFLFVKRNYAIHKREFLIIKKEFCK